MSLITDDPEESPRDCSRSRSSSRKHHRRRHRRALIAVLSTVASLLSLGLILWLTLRPRSPHFSLLAATATVGGSGNATIVVDAALAAQNPNAHATALYDQLRASASYGGVPLGAGAPLQPLEQPDQGDAVLSARVTSSWSGRSAPAPGTVLLMVRVEGQLRWKVAGWVSGRHALTVDCVATVVLSSSSAAAGQQQGSGSSSECATHVL